MTVDEIRNGPAPLARPSQGTHHLDANALAWRPTEAGFWVKPLLADVSTGARTELMRIDPGASAEAHSHEELEEMFVLSGEFSDDGRTYRPGDYCVRAVGTIHGSSSKTGCTVLLIYRT
jgi:anti-sigma factor ChrR (cupin superfamily)